MHATLHPALSVGWLVGWSVTLYFFFINSFSFSRFLSRVHATLHPALSVGWSVSRSHLTFFMIFIFGPHCSCPNSLVTSNMAPAHPHATLVAMYPAFLISLLLPKRFRVGSIKKCIDVGLSMQLQEKQLICEGVFEYSSSISSVFFFSDFKVHE